MKRVLKWFAITVLICVSLVIVGGYWFVSSMRDACETEISETVKSPNGSLEAVVFSIGCGVLGNSDTISQLAIRKTGDTKKLRDDDAIFAIDDYGALPRERYNDRNPRLTLTWISDTQLRVEFPKGPHKLKADVQSNGVSLEYIQSEQ